MTKQEAKPEQSIFHKRNSHLPIGCPWLGEEPENRQVSNEYRKREMARATFPATTKCVYALFTATSSIYRIALSPLCTAVFAFNLFIWEALFEQLERVIRKKAWNIFVDVRGERRRKAFKRFCCVNIVLVSPREFFWFLAFYSWLSVQLG